MTTKFSSRKIFQFCSAFEKQAQEMAVSWQSGDYQNALDKAGLWGGVPFDVNGKLADVIFGVLEKAGVQGKVNASITIDSHLGVHISVPESKTVEAMLNQQLAGRMSQALKAQHAPPPADKIVVPWLEGVGFG